MVQRLTKIAASTLFTPEKVKPGYTAYITAELNSYKDGTTDKGDFYEFKGAVRAVLTNTETGEMVGELKQSGKLFVPGSTGFDAELAKAIDESKSSVFVEFTAATVAKEGSSVGYVWDIHTEQEPSSLDPISQQLLEKVSAKALPKPKGGK